MNFSAKFVTILFILCTGLFAGRGDILFNSIESYLSSYRQSIETGDVTVREGIISVKITARRTNIKSQQLLGFYLWEEQYKAVATLFVKCIL